MQTNVKYGCAILIGGLLAGLCGAGTVPFGGIQKKYIGHGWDLLAVTPAEVLAHAAAFDRTGLDGVTLMINVKLPDGRTISHTNIMNDGPWPRAQLANQIDIFRAIVKHPSLRESFISSWWAPQKRLAWTDDAAWANFASNMATVAWLAKEGGLRGILVDAEDYPRSRQYMIQTGDPAYDETAALARRRGAEVFRAIFKEYPDVTFLSFWMLSLSTRYCSAQQPMAAAKAQGDLWPWFVNGMLDVIPPTACFVDGNECAYHYEAAKKAFYQSACEQHTTALGLVAPENRAKYRAQLRAGFGLYLDSYINPTNSPWYFGPVDGSRLKHFTQNLAQATAAADSFVWVYGEKKAWVPWKNTARKRFDGCATWNETLPGFDDAMLGVKDPVELLHRRTEQVRTEGKFVNLVPATWPTWQDEKLPQGQMGKEGDGVFLASVSRGCHLVSVAGTPGELFGVRTKLKGVGGSATVYFQLNHSWQWDLPAVSVVFADGAPEAWRAGEALVRIPEGADRFVLQLGAHQRPGEKCWFKDVEVYRLNP